MPASRSRRRPAFWVGLVGLGVAALLGATSGWSGALGLALVYLALSAGWGVLTTRTWWGPMPRGRAAATGGGALVALVLVAATAPGLDAGVPATGGSPSPAATTESTVEASAPAETAELPEDAAPRPTKEAAPKAPTGDAATKAPKQPAAAKGTALAAVATLEVKGRAPKTGYDREEFGPAWADVDRNGCDTRVILS